MADNEYSHGLDKLELIRERDVSEEETTTINALALGTADEAEQQLDILCPPLEEGNEAENYIWGMWGIIIDIARSPNVHEEIHERLVGILQHLKQYERGELKVYRVSIQNYSPTQFHLPSISRW